MSDSDSMQHRRGVPQMTAGRAALVDGFESPFGLELLSTVHWVMRHEPARTLPDVVARTYAWNDRKRQFTPRQIALAAEVLMRQCWVPPLAAKGRA